MWNPFRVLNDSAKAIFAAYAEAKRFEVQLMALGKYVKPQEEKMSDLKWGYPELLPNGNVQICQQVKTTEDWLNKSAEWARSEWSCPIDEYRVYRAIIQRWHDQHKAAEKAKAEKPQFKAGDYVFQTVVEKTSLILDPTINIVDNRGYIESVLSSDGNTSSYYTGVLRPATAPEIEQFQREYLGNLGIGEGVEINDPTKEGVWEKTGGKVTSIVFGKDPCVWCGYLGFNNILTWKDLKVVSEPKEQVKEVKDSTVDVKKFVREMIKGLEEVKSIGQPKQDGPADEQVLEALYESEQKIKRCGGNGEKYRTKYKECSLCNLFGVTGSENHSNCEGCPLAVNPCISTGLSDAPCVPILPITDNDHDLTPLSEAVDKAIAELEGKVHGFYVNGETLVDRNGDKWTIGQWVLYRDDNEKRQILGFEYGWSCIDVDGDTSWTTGKPYITPCDPPEKKKPKFKKGDWVRHTLGITDKPEEVDDVREVMVGIYGCRLKGKKGHTNETLLEKCDPPAKPSDTPFMDARDAFGNSWGLIDRWAKLLDERLGK